MMASATYLDASAILKLVIADRETTALRAYLAKRDTLVSSAFSRMEVARAIQSEDPGFAVQVKAVFQRIGLVRITDSILDTAGALSAEMPTPVALHLATALELGRDLAQLVTYDDTVRTATEELDIATVSPGATRTA
jgi:hypothetical protein